MKDKLIVLLGGLSAAIIVIMLLAPQSAETEQARISVPTSLDRGDFGLAGLKNWLDHSNVKTLSLRERYTRLASDPEISDSNNLLLTSLPQRTTTRYDEGQQLRLWLEQGNNIVILAAIVDTPAWANHYYELEDINSYLTYLGYMLDYVGAMEASVNTAKKQQGETQFNDDDIKNNVDDPIATKVSEQNYGTVKDHPILVGVNNVETKQHNDATDSYRMFGAEYPRNSLVLLRNGGSQNVSMWQVRIGLGTAWIIPYADVFSNVSLAKANNAQLLSNIVSATLHSEGAVIFDDMHHGITSLYDPKAFFGDSRLHVSLAFIVGLWLVYLLGHSNRLFIKKPTNTAPSIADHVYAVGGLFARRLTTAAVARRLLRHFFNELRGVNKLPQNGEPVWHLLMDNYILESDLIGRIQAIYNKAQQNKHVDLSSLINVINQIRTVYS